ncbi:MAG: hypothetical protein NC191_04090 [Muribaculaceae bacterium]|nr:hypothetical protein [Muribaculaceae bacterium]
MKVSSNISFKAVFAGVILFFISFVLLWWNEGNYVKNIKIASFAKQNVVSVNAKDSQNEGKLVHVSSQMVTDDIINDEFIKLNAIALSRDVEMYQWKQ